MRLIYKDKCICELVIQNTFRDYTQCIKRKMWRRRKRRNKGKKRNKETNSKTVIWIINNCGLLFLEKLHCFISIVKMYLHKHMYVHVYSNLRPKACRFAQTAARRSSFIEHLLCTRHPSGKTYSSDQGWQNFRPPWVCFFVMGKDRLQQKKVF